MTIDSLGARFARIQNKDVNETFDQSTDSLEALRDFITAVGSGLAFYGVVTAIPGANQFTIPTLAGLGAGKFAGATNPFQAFVFRDAGGASAAPQGEFQPATAYVDATGVFTTAAFTAAVGIGDEILLINPAFEPILDLLVPVADAGTNVLERDVIGNKSDTASFNTDNTSIIYSLMRWVRGIARVKNVLTGNAEAGSTASNIISVASLNQAAGYWFGQRILIMDGVNVRLSRPIVDYNAGTNTITVSPAFPAAIAAGVTFVILSDYQDPLPAADAATNLVPANVIGNKADTTLYAATLTGSLMRYLKAVLHTEVLAIGTFTTSSATVPADTARTEANDAWKGCSLMPLSGGAAFQPKRIVTFTNAGGIFTMDPGNPFTSAPGLVAYAILPAQADFIPVADSARNISTAEVVGNKVDAAVTTVGVIASIIAYVKGLLNQAAAIKAKTDNLPAAPADNAEVETTSLATGAGSAATLTRAGLLLRYLVDSVGAALGTAVASIKTEVETLSLAAGAGSAATTTRAGLLLRYLVDSVGAALGTAVAAIKAVTDLILTTKETNGSVTTDGTEQTVYEVASPARVFKPLIVKIDFTNHTVTETVEIRTYHKIKTGGAYLQDSYYILTLAVPANGNLAQNFTIQPNKWGVKATITKTAGTNRAYDWEVFYED